MSGETVPSNTCVEISFTTSFTTFVWYKYELHACIGYFSTAVPCTWHRMVVMTILHRRTSEYIYSWIKVSMATELISVEQEGCSNIKYHVKMYLFSSSWLGVGYNNNWINSVFAWFLCLNLTVALLHRHFGPNLAKLFDIRCISLVAWRGRDVVAQDTLIVRVVTWSARYLL